MGANVGVLVRSLVLSSMENFQEMCEKQGIAFEKLLEFALKNMEASRQEISFLQQEREILTQKINMQQSLWDTDHQHFQQRLELNEMMHEERELTHKYETAKSNVLHGAQQKDALLLKLRLDYALDDLEDLQMRHEVLMLELKEEQAKAHGLNKCLLEKEKDPTTDQSQIILEVEQRTRSLQESLVKMEKDHCKEIAKVKSECKRINSLRKHEVSALLRERDFVWNQLKKMEEDYADRLKSKSEQLQVASESIEKLRLTMEGLQRAIDEKNIELTILKIELGDKEREAQMLKHNDLEKKTSTDSLQELRPSVKIFEENKRREKEALSMEEACGAATSKESLKLSGLQNRTYSQEITTNKGILSEKDITYGKKLQRNEEITFPSTVLKNEKKKQKMFLDELQLEADNFQLNDKEVSADSAKSKIRICHSLNTELDKLATCSDLVTQSPSNQLLLEISEKEKCLQESHQAENTKVVGGTGLIQYPPGRHAEAALEWHGNNSFKDHNSTSEITIRSNSSNKRRRGADNSIHLAKCSSEPSWEKRNLMPRGKQSVGSDELKKPFGHVIIYEETLHPVKANFFPSSFCVPKVKDTLSLRSFR